MMPWTRADRHSGWRSPVGPAMSAKSSLSVETNGRLLRAQVVFIDLCGYCLNEAELRKRIICTRRARVCPAQALCM